MQTIENHIELDTLGGKISVWLRRSPKAKNISIYIKNRKVELVLPYGTSEEVGYKFLLSKEAWLQKNLRNRQEAPVEGTIHNEYPILDNLYTLRHIEAKSKFFVSIKEKDLIAHTPRNCLAYALTNFFKGKAINEVNSYCKHFSTIHGFEYGKIFVKELKSKWGSCSSTKNLVFNWRIIFAPRPVFNYLIVHELCHLKEMNHSKRFWKLVASILPDYKKSETWLKERGYTLHHYLPITQK
jgi:predicted metal-dependent hydrolase